MNKLALFLLLVLLGQGVIVLSHPFGFLKHKVQNSAKVSTPKRDAGSKLNPNSAVCHIGRNPFDTKPFLHRNAGFLYTSPGFSDKGNQHLNLKDTAIKKQRKAVRSMNFKNFHSSHFAERIFPEGPFRSFEWDKFRADTDTHNKYEQNVFEYRVNPMKNKGDYMPEEGVPQRNNNYIWFSGDHSLTDEGTMPMPTEFKIKYDGLDHTVWDGRNMEFSCVDRRSFGGGLSFLGQSELEWGNHLPLNPKGPSGVKMKFNRLFRYGVNHAADPIVMRRSGKNEYEIIMVRRRGTNYVAIPGGFIDPGHTFGYTLSKEFTEEAAELDPGQLHEVVKEFNIDGLTQDMQWTDLTPETQENVMNLYMKEKFEALLLYKGYSDDDRNSDNAWIETTAVMFLEKTANRSGKGFGLHDDTEGHTGGTFWMKMKKDLRGVWNPVFPKKSKEKGKESKSKDGKLELFASHKFLIRDACKYADRCFKFENGEMVPKNGKGCEHRRTRYHQDEAEAQRETAPCLDRSRALSCCLWIGRCQSVPENEMQAIQSVRDGWEQAYINNGKMEVYGQHQEKWGGICAGIGGQMAAEEEEAAASGGAGGSVSFHLGGT